MVDQGPSQLGAGVSSSAQPPESAPVAAVPPVRAAESWPAVAAASCTEPRQTLRHCHRSSYMYSSLTSHPGACVEKQDYPKFSPPAMAFPEPKPLVRCDSCKSTGTDSVPSSPTVHTLMELNQHGLEQLSEASQMQLRWDRAMCDELKLPEGYLKASVLLIKWRDEEDQFKNTNEEVSPLFLQPFRFYILMLLRCKPFRLSSRNHSAMTPRSLISQESVPVNRHIAAAHLRTASTAMFRAS